MKAFQAARPVREVVVGGQRSTDDSIRIGGRARSAGDSRGRARLRRCAAHGHRRRPRAFHTSWGMRTTARLQRRAAIVEKLREGNDMVMAIRFRGESTRGMPRSTNTRQSRGLICFAQYTFFCSQFGDSYCGYAGIHPQSCTTAWTCEVRDGIPPRDGHQIRANRGAHRGDPHHFGGPTKRGRAPHSAAFRDGWRSIRFMLLLRPDWLFCCRAPRSCWLDSSVFWLLPGPRRFLPTWDSTSTMIFGVIFTPSWGADSLMGAFRKSIQLCGASLTAARIFARV